MKFEEAMEHVVQGFEIAGVAVLVVGSILAFVCGFVSVFSSGGRTRAQRHTRPRACQVACLMLDKPGGECRLELSSRFAYRRLPLDKGGTRSTGARFGRDWRLCGFAAELGD